MRGAVLVAPDKFKGSLSASRVARCVAAGLRRRLPALTVHEMPVADGGDGTLDAVYAAGFRRVAVRASGPTGDPVDTAYAERNGTAIVELASVSGLGQLPGGTRAPLTASSYGAGEVIRAALDAGCRRIVFGLGGTACTDGGAGMLQALGARLVDADAREIARGGLALRKLVRVDFSGLHPAIASCEFVVASDVDNPLLGSHGAAAVYGPQKGAVPEQVSALEAALGQFADVLGARATAALPGAGAAGGVGFAALVALGARIVPGIEYVLGLVGFHDAVRTASAVVTGEGSLDPQTLRGKAPAGVAAAAKTARTPVYAVSGRCLLSEARLHEAGFKAGFALTDIEPDPSRCMADAVGLVQRLAADRLAPALAREVLGCFSC